MRFERNNENFGFRASLHAVREAKENLEIADFKIATEYISGIRGYQIGGAKPELEMLTQRVLRN